MRLLTKLFVFMVLFLIPGYVHGYEQGAGSGATTQISCLVTTTTIAARDSTRFSFLIENTDTSNPVWICFAGTGTCTITTGHQLDPGTTNGKNSISNSFPYESVGPISCIATGGTVIINYTRLIK